MRWLRELWIEVVFVALLVSVSGAMLQATPRVQPEAVSLGVLFLSYLGLLGAATFLILRSSLVGWWLVVMALMAVAGARLVADGVECVLLGASPGAVVGGLAVHGGLAAMGLVLVVLLARGWRPSVLRLRPAAIMATVPAAARLVLAYAFAYALAVWALSAAGLTYRRASATGFMLLLAVGAARAAAMVACATPLLLTLLGHRIKNAEGVGALFGLSTVAAHLAAARSLSGEVLGGAAVQGALSFLLGMALVRLTRPPLVEREASWERAAISDANPGKGHGEPQ